MRFFLRAFSIVSCFFTPLAFAASETGGRGLNPDISVNFLGLAQHGTAYSGNLKDKPRNGLSLQEAELQFTADVDPYLRANALFSVGQESGSASYSVSPEEVFLETISLPYVTIRAGKFKMALGRHNQLHAHAFPFISAPLIHTRILGDEGLNDAGISASALIPAPWFSEFTLQAFSLRNETLFGYNVAGDVGALARWKNLWDLRDSLTMELGFSGARGKNSRGVVAHIWESDLTFKWRPTESTRQLALIWSTEYLQAKRTGLNQDRTVNVNGSDVTVQDSLERLGGVATWLQFQFARRWWIQGRYEYSGLVHSPAVSEATKESALLAFLPSEFSAIRLQYDWIQDKSRPRKDHAIALQYNVSIGAHPAHTY